ncbi:MAG: hypothetical protein EOO04_28435 [Chitinophagaceae bacterium]|nr:MAG: hypothetical protein EOO04_28435 [Chitinophagaceae bacterium]
MKSSKLVLIAIIFIVSCESPSTPGIESSAAIPLTGSWKLFNGTLIEKGDTVTTDYTKNTSFIKIINNTHFAFLQHDLQKGKDSTAAFSAGGGKYTLKDSVYTEHLEYCTAREWEGHDFTFNIHISNDTLVQRGVEIVESAGINRINIEKYTRVK